MLDAEEFGRGDWRPYARSLVARLRADGTLTDPVWARLMAEVPRHLFVTPGHLVDQSAGPDGRVPDVDRELFLSGAYANEVVVTRYAMAGGGSGGPVRPVATSSASQPAIVAIMLDRLTVRDGHRVLEIGTGTGYNAALLCARLGDENVTSVDIQPDLVAAAGRHLAALGRHPRLVVGDGSDGCPWGAPFDRVIATCALDRIPPRWLPQLAEDGRIVAPMTFGGALAVLDRRPDGSVCGRFDAECGFFMNMRDRDAPIEPIVGGDLSGAGRTGRTEVGPPVLRDMDFRLWLSIHVPGAQVLVPPRDDDEPVTRVMIGDAGAQLSGQSDEDGWLVTEYPGAGRAGGLWRRVERAHESWLRLGRPARDRLGIVARAGGQYVWLDDPDGDLRWPLPLPADGS